MVLLQGPPNQDPLHVAAAAADLRGSNLNPREAVGLLLLLQLLHRRAQRLHALYEQGPPRPLEAEALIGILAAALKPAAAAAAAALQLALQQQQIRPSFEAFASLLLQATETRKERLSPLWGPPEALSNPFQGPPQQVTRGRAPSSKRPLEIKETPVSSAKRQALHCPG